MLCVCRRAAVERKLGLCSVEAKTHLRSVTCVEKIAVEIWIVVVINVTDHVIQVHVMVAHFSQAV